MPLFPAGGHRAGVWCAPWSRGSPSPIAGAFVRVSVSVSIIALLAFVPPALRLSESVNLGFQIQIH